MCKFGKLKFFTSYKFVDTIVTRNIQFTAPWDVYLTCKNPTGHTTITSLYGSMDASEVSIREKHHTVQRLSPPNDVATTDPRPSRKLRRILHVEIMDSCRHFDMIVGSLTYYNEIVFEAPAAELTKRQFLEHFITNPSLLTTVDTITFGKQWGAMCDWSPNGKPHYLKQLIKTATLAKVKWENNHLIDDTE